MLATVPGSSFNKLSEYYKTALQQQTKPLHSTLLNWSPFGTHSKLAPLEQPSPYHKAAETMPIESKPQEITIGVKNPEDRSQPAVFPWTLIKAGSGHKHSSVTSQPLLRCGGLGCGFTRVCTEHSRLNKANSYASNSWLHWFSSIQYRLQEQTQDYTSYLPNPSVYSDLIERTCTTFISRALTTQVSQQQSPELYQSR